MHTVVQYRWRAVVNIAELFEFMDWGAFFIMFLSVFVLGIFMFRRSSYFIFDPGWLVVFNLSISVSLAEYLYFIQKQGRADHALYLFSAFFLFLTGARVTASKPKPLFQTDTPHEVAILHDPEQINKLKQLLVCFQILIMLMLVLRASTQGLPIFAEDPEMAKVMVNADGFGLITRLMAPSVLMASSIAMLLRAYRVISLKKFFLMLVPIVLVLLSSGSKGAFISLLIAYAIVKAYLFTISEKRARSGNYTVIILFVLMIIAYAFLVLLLRGSEESDPLFFALNIFAVRLLAYGDAVFYFFFNDLYNVISFQPYNYVWDYMLSPILAMLRLIDYPITLGVRISSEMFGIDKLGPNPTLFVEGYSYFGFVFGLLYSFLIGMLFQFLRKNAFSESVKSSAWGFLCFAAFFSLALLLPFDMILVVADIIDTIMVVSLVWIVHQIFMFFYEEYVAYTLKHRLEGNKTAH
jgi:oligosaccharide repeat unit polymerase